MEQHEVEELARVRGPVAVSILMPVRSSAPVHDLERLRLKVLIDQAGEIVERAEGRKVSKAVLRQISSLPDQTDFGHVGDGFAVFATPDSARVMPLPFGVREQVVVDQTFATRQLFVGLARQPRYRVLVLARSVSHLFEQTGPRMVEITDAGFPLHVEVPHEWDTPQKDLPIHESLEAEEHRFAYRAVDDALAAVNARAPLPIVVTGATREVSYFDEVSQQREQVVGRVHADLAVVSPEAVAAVALPVIEEYLAAQRAEAISELREARGRGRAVVGVSAVQQAVEEGRGHRLVVEEDFEFPVHLVDGFEAPGPEKQLDHDDIVDEIVERVVLTGGAVVFVPPGELADIGHIGLQLRY